MPTGAAAGVPAGAVEEPAGPRNNTAMNGWMSTSQAVEVAEYTTMHAIAAASRSR